jgi:uncharacterized protein
MDQLLLVSCVVAYNNVCNRWPRFGGALYVPMNLVAAALLVVVALGPLGLRPHEIGLVEISGGGFVLGAALGGAVVAPLFMIVHRPRATRLLADRRFAQLDARSFAYHALIRIPLGTALLEELAFRGVVLAALRERGALASAALAGVAFGLWHIVPTLNAARINRPAATRLQLLGAVGVAFAFTTAAGLLLTALREATGDLGAPFALHSTVNSLGLVVALAANRAMSRARRSNVALRGAPTHARHPG